LADVGTGASKMINSSKVVSKKRNESEWLREIAQVYAGFYGLEKELLTLEFMSEKLEDNIQTLYQQFDALQLPLSHD
ncbi:MAG: hypothetical protein AAFV25_21020, partial [Bacteroidota bacterium]